jgi:hypothetical protein
VRQFETENSDSTRLTDRRTNSARWMKDAKFRKEAQIKYVTL